jgi:allophanate hydrolase subunit 2
VPPDGRPLVLLADHQPTGGYPVIGVVPIADRPRLGQLRPGSVVRFEVVATRQAVDALRRQRAALGELERVRAEAERWDEDWRSASG